MPKAKLGAGGAAGGAAEVVVDEPKPPNPPWTGAAGVGADAEPKAKVPVGGIGAGPVISSSPIDLFFLADLVSCSLPLDDSAGAVGAELPPKAKAAPEGADGAGADPKATVGLGASSFFCSEVAAGAGGAAAVALPNVNDGPDDGAAVLSSSVLAVVPKLNPPADGAAALSSALVAAPPKLNPPVAGAGAGAAADEAPAPPK